MGTGPAAGFVADTTDLGSVICLSSGEFAASATRPNPTSNTPTRIRQLTSRNLLTMAMRPPSETFFEKHHYRLDSTATVVSTTAGSPFTRYGSNFHHRNASIAARASASGPFGECMLVTAPSRPANSRL